MAQSDTSDREKAKAAQLARAKQYHIGVKAGGNVTKPDEWKHVPDSEWADPVNYRYPCHDKVHADNAAARWGDVSNRAQYSSAEQKIIGDRITARQKHFGTKAAQDDDKQESTSSESVSMRANSGFSSSTRPKERIASVRVRWITDGARSLNGRVYPASTVDRLIASGQRKLADPNALPITCFLSHKDADADNTPALVGKVTRLWREGADGMAMIDIADTTHARDALGLITGKYICTESLRASNAELRTDPRYDVPVVAGDRIELDGIDLTNYPGLEQVARIQSVNIAESAGSPTRLTDVFAIDASALEISPTTQKGHVMSHLNEAMPPGGNTAGGYQPTSGEAPYMTSDNPNDSYHQRMYKQPDMTSGPMQGMNTVGMSLDVQEAHDRIAMVQNRACAPSRESARGIAALASMTPLDQADMALREAGRALSAKNDAHLDAAHHAIARHLGLACEGKNNKMGNRPYDPDNDGDDDSDPSKNPDRGLDQLQDNNMESARKGKRPMNREQQIAEARRLLESEGHIVQAPKTETEILREQIAAMQAEQKRQQDEQAKQLEEMKALIAQNQQASTPTPQRRSQVLGANIDEPKTGRYQPMHGRHLQEQINKLDWSALADRTAPLPDTVPLDLLMREMEQYYAVMYDDRYGILTALQ